MSSLNYVKGDLFKALPPYTGDAKRNILIPHVCNDVGAWGAGFVVALSKYDPEPETEFRAWAAKHRQTRCPVHVCASNRTFGLGETQIVDCKQSYVANMVAQHKTISKNGQPPIRYHALVSCMKYVHFKMKEDVYNIRAKEIWCPKFGSGLAGGNWDFIETLIKEIWVDNDIPVTVFEL